MINNETISIISGNYGVNFDRNWNSMSRHKRRRFERHTRDVWCF